MVTGKGLEETKDYTLRLVIERPAETLLSRRRRMASSKIQILNEINFDSVVQEARGPVLVDFTAAWCGPCKAQSVILDRIAEESDQVLIAAVDVDDSPELARRFGVRGMPTLVAFNAGKETARRNGLSSEQAVRSMLAVPGNTSARTHA